MFCVWSKSFLCLRCFTETHRETEIGVYLFGVLHRKCYLEKFFRKEDAEAGPSAEVRIEAHRKHIAARVQAKKREKTEAGPSAEAKIEARRKRIAARVQANKRQVVGDDVQKKEEARPCQRQVEQSERRMAKLKADGTELVTNILVAADARELKRREELREANRLRLEKLENEVKSSTEKFNKIMNKWTEAKTTKIHQKLRDNLRQQQQLCWQVIEDKNKLINELQQELQASNAYFAKDRKREAEEVDLLIKRMQKQTSSLKKDYRKELDLIERSFSDEWMEAHSFTETHRQKLLLIILE